MIGPEQGRWRIGDVGFADNVALAQRYVLLTFPTVLLVDDLCTHCLLEACWRSTTLIHCAR